MLLKVLCVAVCVGVAAAAIGDPCDPGASGQCTDVANAFCDPDTSACACKDRFLVTSTGKCDGVLGRSCSIDFAATCNQVPYALCLGPTCECSREYVKSDLKTACWTPTYGGHCLEDLQCEGLGEASCVDEKCVCKDGYVSSGASACYPTANGLDEQCDVDAQCSAYDMHAGCLVTLQGNRCKCRVGSGWVHSADNTKCVEVAHQVGDSCEVAEQCENFDINAECTGTSCACVSGYIGSIDGVNCITQEALGSNCQQDQQCNTVDSNSGCIEGKCGCLDGFFDDGSGACVPTHRFSRHRA